MMASFSLIFLMAVSLVTINVNGLRDANKRLSFLQWLSHSSPSIVCLQETHAVSDGELRQWFSSYGFLAAGVAVRCSSALSPCARFPGYDSRISWAFCSG